MIIGLFGSDALEVLQPRSDEVRSTAFLTFHPGDVRAEIHVESKATKWSTDIERNGLFCVKLRERSPEPPHLRNR